MSGWQEGVYIALGSNLDHPRAQMRRAVSALRSLAQSELTALSPMYRSRPQGGPEGQPDYLNAVARLRTRHPPLALLDALQAIEQAQGRERRERWGPRTLDLDLLLFGQRRIRHPRLQVPHPRLRERAFVLYPLADIAPGDLLIPGEGRLDALLRACSPEGLGGPERDWA